MTTSPNPGWTDDRVEKLKMLWLTGLSCSAIAVQLRGVSRNAVIGKVYRLGLSGREAAYKPGRPAAAAKAPATPRQPRPAVIRQERPKLKIAGRGTVFEQSVAHPPRVTLPETAEAPGGATIHTIAPGMCKWPIGDPREPGFTFCGHKAERSYCAAHTARAYQPLPPRSEQALVRSLRRYA